MSYENPFREIYTFLERFNKIAFTQSCTIKLYYILKVKNALVKYVYHVAVYTISNLDTSETKYSYVLYEIGKEFKEATGHRAHKTTQDQMAAVRECRNI